MVLVCNLGDRDAFSHAAISIHACIKRWTSIYACLNSKPSSYLQAYLFCIVWMALLKATKDPYKYVEHFFFTNVCLLLV